MTDQTQMTYLLRPNHIRITSRISKIFHEVAGLQEHYLEIKHVAARTKRLLESSVFKPAPNTSDIAPERRPFIKSHPLANA